MPHVEQELLTLPEDLSSLSVLSGVRIVRSLVLCVMFCRSMFVFLSFFFWALCCLSFFDLRLQTFLSEHNTIKFSSDIMASH